MPPNSIKRLNQELVFPETSLLTMYNRGTLYTRAMKTNDNETNEMPLQCPIVMCQMREPFIDPAVRERFISVELGSEGKNEDAYKEIMRFKDPNQDGQVPLASLGVSVLKKRKFFQDNLKAEIKYWAKFFEDNHVTNNRIRDHYAIALAGFSLFFKCFKEELGSYGKNLIEKASQYALKSAKDKASSIVEDSNQVAVFFDAFEELAFKQQGQPLADPVLKEGKDWIKDGDLVYIKNLTNVISVMRRHQLLTREASEVMDALELSSAFVCKNRQKSSSKWEEYIKKPRCWWFRPQQLRLVA